MHNTDAKLTKTDAVTPKNHNFQVFFNEKIRLCLVMHNTIGTLEANMGLK